EAILNLDTLTKGADGLRVPVLRLGGFGALGDTGRYYLTAVTAALMVAAAVNLVRTRTGRAFLAIRESEIAAQASGVTVAAFQNYRPLIFGAILIACMLFMPGGIVRALARSVTWGAPTWPPTPPNARRVPGNP